MLYLSCKKYATLKEGKGDQVTFVQRSNVNGKNIIR